MSLPEIRFDLRCGRPPRVLSGGKGRRARWGDRRLAASFSPELKSVGFPTWSWTTPSKRWPGQTRCARAWCQFPASVRWRRSPLSLQWTTGPVSRRRARSLSTSDWRPSA